MRLPAAAAVSDEQLWQLSHEGDRDAFGMIVASMNGSPIVAERSMYWNAGGVFWAGGITTAGTRLP